MVLLSRAFFGRSGIVKQTKHQNGEVRPPAKTDDGLQFCSLTFSADAHRRISHQSAIARGPRCAPPHYPLAHPPPFPFSLYPYPLPPTPALVSECRHPIDSQANIHRRQTKRLKNDKSMSEKKSPKRRKRQREREGLHC